MDMEKCLKFYGYGNPIRLFKMSELYSARVSVCSNFQMFFEVCKRQKCLWLMFLNHYPCNCVKWDKN